MITCPSCGKSLPDGAAFCGNCGSKVEPATAYTPPTTYAAPAGGGYAGGGAAYASGGVRTSFWDGGVLETIGATLVYALITTITCGIATPWAVCYFYKFILSHTVLDGRRARFDGDGASLFGNWIVWMILTVITCGIYGFWVTPKMLQWFTSHTHLE